MPDIFDRLGRMTFDAIPIPHTGYIVNGGQRKHVHSYVHVNKGKPEKLGSELTTVDVHCIFDTSLEGQYPGNYPSSLFELIKKFEFGTTANLYIPTRGTLRCFADGWTVEMSARVRSGESANITFIEDPEDGFTFDDFALVSQSDFASKALTVAELRALYNAEMSDAEKSLFDKIDSAVNVVRGAIDTVELVGTVVLAKVERLVNLCAEVESTVALIQDPLSYPLFESVKELWSSATKIGEDVKGKRTPVQLYTVPGKMSLSQVSLSIYGDSTRGQEILQLNFFEDAFAIQAGTVVYYYPDSIA